MEDIPNWPVIEDLPEEEQEPFRKWLRGHTVPLNSDGTAGFYSHDYIRWKDHHKARPSE